jgi:hypothetical protein
MRSAQASGKVATQPYPDLRDDPRYDELKQIIDDCPREKMKELESYIKRWLRNS